MFLPDVETAVRGLLHQSLPIMQTANWVMFREKRERETDIKSHVKEKENGRY